MLAIASSFRSILQGADTGDISLILERIQEPKEEIDISKIRRGTIVGIGAHNTEYLLEVESNQNVFVVHVHCPKGDRVLGLMPGYVGRYGTHPIWTKKHNIVFTTQTELGEGKGVHATRWSIEIDSITLYLP